MRKLLVILLLGYFLNPGQASKPRLKRDTQEELLLSSISEIQEVGRVVLKLSTSLDTKVEEIKTELRKEMQAIRSELKKDSDELKSQILTQQNVLNTKLDGIKTEFKTELGEIKSQMLTLPNSLNARLESLQLQTSSLVLKDAKMDLKLEKLETKIDVCLNSITQSEDKILQKLNNTGIHQDYLLTSENQRDWIKTKMQHLEKVFEDVGKTITTSISDQGRELKKSLSILTNQTDSFNAKLASINSTMCKNEVQLSVAIDVGNSNPPKIQDINGTVLVKDVLSSLSEFKTQTLISTGTMVEKADRVVRELRSFMRNMVNAQLNDTLNSMIAFENKTDYSIAEIWPLLKSAHFPPSLLSDVFGRLAGILRGEEWILIQTRGVPLKAGRTREKFHNRTWAEYSNGFGSYDADFWFGLDKIHDLTEAGFTELRVEIEDWEGNTAYVSYSYFNVAGSSDNYRLTVSGYSGTAGDSLTYSSGQQFSTVDKDNDAKTGYDCVLRNGGPWWHKDCTYSFLNFDYQNGSKVKSSNGIIWYHWKSSWEYSLKKTEMKIRRPPRPN